MVIYYRLTLVVLTHCFARPTGGSLQTLYDLWSRHVSFTIEELGAETDIKLFNAIVGNPAHILYHYYLHTDQLNIHYENGVTRSFYTPSIQHTSEQHS